MKGLYLFIVFCASFGVHAQTVTDSTVVDTRYREDQFYMGLTYNFVLNRPDGVSQRNLSYGLQAGFIRDMPLNRDRTVAIGLGLGYNINSYYSNLFVREASNGFEYSVLGSDDFNRSKLETHLIEVPLELRWRTSTPTEYRFWRIYAGARFGYVVGARSKFVSDTFKDSFYNTDIRKFRYGVTLSIGYNTFNIHAYYALVDLMDDGVATVTGENVTLRPLRIGIIFYIL